MKINSSKFLPGHTWKSYGTGEKPRVRSGTFAIFPDRLAATFNREWRAIGLRAGVSRPTYK
jgi:hypothetical protein